MKSNVKCAHTKMMKVSDLENRAHPGNENKHSKEQIRALSKIIAKVGQRSPIVISNRSKYITKGHGRVQAIKLLGWTEAAVDIQEYENDLEELNDRVADNEIARYAEFQKNQFIENLTEMDVDLAPLDFEEFGLIDFEIGEDSKSVDVSEHSREIDSDEKEEFDHICPKCKFGFNESKDA